MFTDAGSPLRGRLFFFATSDKKGKAILLRLKGDFRNFVMNLTLGFYVVNTIIRILCLITHQK